jgi:pimeloyl-ACP methyl ester carboxylesterase
LSYDFFYNLLMSEHVIPPEVAEQYRQGAADIRQNDRRVPVNSLARLNGGLPRLTRAGEVVPDNPLNVNAGDFIPKTTNIHGEPLTLPPSRTTQEGDSRREVPETREWKNPETGQTIRYVLYNWDKKREGEPVTALLPSYNTRVDRNTTAQTRHDELAVQMPETPFIAVMHPGMGSDPLTRAQKRELKTQNAYFDVADTMLDMMQSLDVKQINIVGDSMGAFAGLAIAVRAQEKEITVAQVVLAKLPGVEETNFIEMMKREGSGGAFLPVEWSGPFDPYIYKAGGLHRSNLRQQIEGLRWAGRLLKTDKRFLYGRAMAKDTALDRLRGVLEVPESRVTLIGGTEDPVSPNKSIGGIMSKLRSEGYGADKLNQLVFQGAHHALLENPLQYAATIKHVLTGSSL